MEQIGYQIVHSIAGRIRIRVHWLEADVEAASKYQRLLEALSYVNSVRINPLAQSIVILYNSRQLAIAEAEELFISAMQQAKPTPPMQTTTIETEPAQSAPEPEPVTTTTTSTKPTQSTSPEIPSPWDEPDEMSLDADPKEPERIEPINHAQSKESLSIQAHSTSSLAQRLRVTSQAITQRRNKTDFEAWTQAQDPDNLAWHYDEITKLFYPVSHPTESRPSSNETVEVIEKNLCEEAGAVMGEEPRTIADGWIGDEIAQLDEENQEEARDAIAEKNGKQPQKQNYRTTETTKLRSNRKKRKSKN